MRIGQPLTVSIEGIPVAEAVVEEIDGDTVTILIPGTRVVMGVKHSLTDETPAPETDRMLSNDVQRPEPVESHDTGESLRNMDLDSSAVD